MTDNQQSAPAAQTTEDVPFPSWEAWNRIRNGDVMPRLETDRDIYESQRSFAAANVTHTSCVSCKERFSDTNCFTQAGWQETQISGLCERCFDQMCEGAEAEETWVDWLEARAPRLGVSLVRAACIASRAPPLVVPRESAPPARMPVVDFEGEFEVREPERLRKACLEGVGGARAFGCGLLLLKPVYRR